MQTATKIKFEYLPLILLVLILGIVAGSELFPEYRKQSWAFLFVAFALISTIYSYFQNKNSNTSKHFFHWLGAFGALMTIFIFEQAGVVSPSQMTLFIIVLLGFTTFSSGLYTSISESGIGILLVVYAVIMALLEEYLWIVWLVIISLTAYQLYRLKVARQNTHSQDTKDLV